jgi:isopropylmalate/homocitrate/citramalate synthase
MADQPWKTDQWFASPWNHLPEVTESFRLPNRVQVHDVTLRDGEQQAGVVFTGEQLFNVESGIITTWVRNVGDQLTESFPYRPELVGQPAPSLVLGKGSGLDSVAAALERLGRSATLEQIERILSEVKERSLADKGLLDDDQFLEIVDRVV